MVSLSSSPPSPDAEPRTPEAGPHAPAVSAAAEPVSPPQIDIDLKIGPQPTDTSCGPTCLEAIYRYWDDPLPIGDLIREVPSLDDGGTLAVSLGLHALKRGWRARLYTYNLRVFDPTWFDLRPKVMRHQLAARITCTRRGKRHIAAKAYLRFLEKGGEVRFQDLTGRLIRRYLDRHIPILTGLSSTFLYRTMREIPETNEDDDIRGEPAGHFVVLTGYDRETREVLVADPYEANPFSADRRYRVSMNRLLNAILLGVLTYDANLLIIRPPK